MDLQFEPEVFTPPPSCGCAACQSEVADEWELPDEEVAKPCSGERPSDVTKCTSNYPSAPAQLCKPGAGKRCLAIPELWTSQTIAGVEFWYKPSSHVIPGTKRYALDRVARKNYAVQLTPVAWNALAHFIGAMIGFGLPLKAILTLGAGPYCRCVKNKGCDDDHAAACTGTTLSNHGAGDAIDVAGVVWADPKGAGSSLKATLAKSWADTGDQGALLRRIEAILRLSFATVIDSTRWDHKDHFHCDTNQRGLNPWNWSSTEPTFVIKALAARNLVSSATVNWANMVAGLTAFATKAKLPVPTQPTQREYPRQWRPVLDKLYSCIALNNPSGCP